MNLFDKFKTALPLDAFLAKYGTPPQHARWKQTFDAITLTDAQRQLLSSFKRELNVLVLAGAWCGDCSGQCPAFDRFAEAAPVIKVRYIDRDAEPEAQRELQICGGNRVPVLVFFSEDGFEISRYGERTLSKYRQLIQDSAGAGCPTGLVRSGDPLPMQVTQDWLNEFERAQWIVRLFSQIAI